MGQESEEADVRRDTKYRVGDLTLDPARRVVTRDGKEIPLGKLSYDFLLLLVESAPSLVSHKVIKQRLWANRVVTEDTVRQRVKLLRNALGDDSGNPRYLNVVRGQGYRLIPEIRQLVNESVRPSRPIPRVLSAVAAIAVMVAIASAFWPKLLKEPTLSAPPGNSIAVLPFEALTPSSDDYYFVDGFHNDLLTQLARIDDLSVISRTSVLEYRDKKKKLSQIGLELGVATILEGSVQRSGANVRINAQLIDARNDRHIWAEVYDREITAENLFDIQAEMASAIALALQIELSTEERNQLEAIPTESIRAYNYYLLGIHHSEGTESLNSFRNAALAFQQAVDDDPKFALAWAALSRCHSALYFFDEHSDARQAQSKAALDHAFSLQPDLPEAHLALGYYLYHTDRNYEAAQQAWDIAEQGMPGDHRIYMARSIVYGRTGDSNGAIDNLSKSIELDPRNVKKLITLAFHYTRVREFGKAEALYDRVLHLAPNDPIGYRRRADIPLWRDGDVTKMRAILHSAPMPIMANSIEWLAAFYERDSEAALNLLDSWETDAVDAPRVYRPKTWFYGVTYELAEDHDRAAEQFRLARSTIEEMLQQRPNDLRLKVTLADIMARQGERVAAVKLATQVLRALPTTRDAMLGPNFRLYVIKVFLAAADYDAAITELDAYLSAPAVWTIEGLLPDPRLDPIRDDPRFIELLDRFTRS